MVVANVVPDPRPSGPLLRVLHVAERLREQGYETHIITDESISSSVLDRAREQASDVHLMRLPRIRAPKRIKMNAEFLLSLPWTVMRIDRLIRNIGADVTHVNGWLTFAPAIASAQAGVPVLWHINDMLVPGPLAIVTKPIVNRYADTIALASKAVGKYFFNNPDKGEVLYSQVDVGKFSPNSPSEDTVESLRSELGVKDGMYVVGTVGNVSPNKGHDILVEAVPSVLEEHPETVFVIVGDLLDTKQEFHQSLLDRAEELGVRSRVVLAGFQTDIPSILSLFDVFAFPSRSEACPQSVLEAMSMEVPVVASRTGGIKEQVTDKKDGLLVPVDDADALAAAINNLLASSAQRERLGKKARRTVIERFSIQRCVEKHIELYEKVTK